VLALRRANRGMEGMTIDPASDRIHAFLQSPLSDGKTRYAVSGKDEKIERFARFLRWIEFDPASGATVRMLAYPLDGAEYADGRTGNAKLGDVVALGSDKFIVIEQGESAGGGIVNRLMLVELAGATDILAPAFNPATSDLEKSSMRDEPVHGADWSHVTPLKKSMLLDLNAIGWKAEKAEGLALADERTLGITNDNDFGMKTRVFDAKGAELAHADVTNFEVDAQGNIVAGSAPTDRVRVAKGANHERPLTLWLLRFDRPLASYSVP
ncbi:MAG: esterase-like activity of phytase family protein, partial [Massilia sp.]|nr:esterase-like activity of phytase family protein [Massilia sp.]